MDYVQYVVDVDAAKCKRAGVSPSDILDVISGYYGGIYASNSFASPKYTGSSSKPARNIDWTHIHSITFISKTETKWHRSANM